MDRRESMTNTRDINNTNDPQKKYRLGTISKNVLLEGLNQFHGAPTSPLVQMWIKTHRCLVCMKKIIYINYINKLNYNGALVAVSI